MQWIIDSYNTAIEKTIPEVVFNRQLDISKNQFIRFRVESIIPPENSAQWCRIYNETYTLSLEIGIYLNNQEKISSSIIQIPCLLGCKFRHHLEDKEECPIDPRGYFIFNGTEYFILNQEKIRLRYPLGITDKNGFPYVYFSSKSFRGSSVTWVKINKKHKIRVKIWSFSGTRTAEFAAICAATGNAFVSSIYPIVNAFVSKAHQRFLDKKENIKEYFDRKLGIYDGNLKDKLLEDLFPGSEQVGNKWNTICKMVERAVLIYFGFSIIDDRNNWGLKRLENVGIILESIFIKLWNSEIDNILTSFSKETDLNIRKFVKKMNFENISMKICLVRTWNLGVVLDLLHRESPLSLYSQITRVSSSANKKSKSLKIRMVHPSQIGYICMFETPEGESCGLVKALTTSCRISKRGNEKKLYQFLLDNGFLSPDNVDGIYTVFLNGIHIGTCNEDFTPTLRDLLKNNQEEEVSVVFREALREIIISNDDGRVIRYDKNQGRYIDALEQYYHLVLKDEEMTEHIFGYAASMIPFIRFNQAPRITYQCSMGRQALSSFHSHLEDRFDNTIRVLKNAEVPLIRTSLHDQLGFDKLPSGHNVDIMIATWKGWNQEDAIIVNRNLIEKQNKFHFDIIHNYSASSSVTRSFIEKITGTAKEGIYVKEGDLLVKKTRIWVKSNKKEQDVSLYVPYGEQGIIDKVLELEGKNGEKIVRIRIVDHRKLQEGDKLASRFAQKGVVGKIFDESELPKWKDGTTPDFIINPHSMPSRMTVGQLMEMILGFVKKYFPDESKDMEEKDIEKAGDLLEQKGFDRYLLEDVFSPDGKRCIGKAQRGVCFYQLLRHLVLDKIQYRSKGKINVTTRQASHGRSVGGGIRIGDMEIRAIASHGAYEVLKERISDSSDGTNFPLCLNCNQIGFIRKHDQYVCISCGNDAKFTMINIPFSFRFLQFLLIGSLLRIDIFVE